MIKTLEKSGRTAEDAVAAALEELGLERDDVSVEIVERAKSGFLGIGASPAVIRVSYEAPDEPEEKPVEAPKPKKKEKAASRKPEKAAEEKKAPAAQEETAQEPLEVQNQSKNPDAPKVAEFLMGLFEHMNVEAGLKLSDTEDDGINVIVYGPNMGTIIGRRGETLDAVQHLVNYSINRGGEKIFPKQVEEVILQYPGIHKAAVYAVSDRAYGEVAAAALIPEAGAVIDTEKLKAFLMERIAKYEVPVLYRIVREFPVTQNGKVRKQELRKQTEEGGY